ncbi:MAG: hypothetical protein MRJ67_05330 [Nitrospirales bacterium]|nr:hypothetical protein [Nitrospira sp.]MDR4459930.1 hypothetical protein [Nitrospirales bacterium]
MKQPLLVIQRNLWMGILMAVLLLTMLGTALGSDSSVQTDSPSVFQPKETQHGFSQYDTPPDHFSDVPSLYDSYSQSPLIPSLDNKPGGVFLGLDFAESFEVKPTTRGGHTHIPVRPTDTFLPHVTSVYLVFTVHEHLSSYQIIGRLFSESETGMDAPQWLDEDIVDLATEDESGFLKFFPPDGVWQPGRYRVEIFVGYIANDVNKLGTMRFTIAPHPAAPAVP